MSIHATRCIVCALLVLVAGCWGRTPVTLEQIEAEQLALPAVYLTADGREGVAAFFAKRTPDYRGA